jgi:hypothetical protein
VAQKIVRVFDPAGAPQRAAIKGCPQLARPEGPLLRRQLNRPLDQAPIQLVGDQTLAEANQRAFAEGRFGAVEAVQHQLPAAIHRGGLNHFIVGGSYVRLENRGQGQLSGRDGWLSQRAFLVEQRQFLLKRLRKEGMALLTEKDKQLGASNPFHDRLFCWGRFNRWMPQRWTHVRLPHVLKMARSKPYAQPAVNHYLNYLTGVLVLLR